MPTVNSSPRLTPHPFWPRHLPQAIAVPETTLWFNVEVAAKRFPNKAAYVFLGHELTYRELEKQATAIAGWLSSIGVKKGDRVLLQMQNCPQFVIAFYAIVRADAIVVPVSPMSSANELQHYIEDARPAAVLCTADVAPILVSAIGNLETLPPPQLLVTNYVDVVGTEGEASIPSELKSIVVKHALPGSATSWLDAINAGFEPGSHDAQPADAVLMPYTSGTTGKPKGCLHTHRSLMPNAVAGATWPQMSASSLSLTVLPMFHITGLVFGVLVNIYLGATAVVMPRWNREVAGRWIASYKITNFVCIPTMIIDMFGSPNYTSFDLGSLLNLIGGGAPMPEAVATRLKKEFNIDFAEGYGLTETAALVLMNPLDRPKLQCLGIPTFGNDVRIVNPDTNAEVEVGQQGEIILCGPTLFMKYWNQDEATDQAFVQFEGRRFFRTGDIGYRDQEGYFYATDRLKRMINASGFKVWPAEVEALLYRHPSVQEACVIGVPDDYRGESVCAVIVPRSNADALSAKDISDWARTQMAPYKVPKAVKFVSELPKTASGKILWREVQAKYRSEALQ